MRHAADRLERGSVTRQYDLHRLTLGEAPPDQPGEASTIENNHTIWTLYGALVYCTRN